MNNTALAVIEKAMEPGITQQEIADAVGVCQQRVSQIVAKDNIKAMIQAVQEGFMAANAKRAAGNITQIIHSPNPKDKELRLKYSAEVARGIGLLPSHAPSVFVQQINNTNTVNIDAHVQALSSNFSPVAPDPDVIDCDYTTDDGV